MLRTMKAVRSRHPLKMCSNRSEYTAGPGAVLGEAVKGVPFLSRRWYVADHPGRHCLEPIDVIDLGRGSVSLVCFSPTRCSAPS
jgi:hypothetical protein